MVPAAIGGIYAGMWIACIGGDADGMAWFIRGAAFICPMMAVAWFMHWRWLPVMTAYALGFYHGYSIPDRLGEQFGSFLHGMLSAVSIPGALLTGRDPQLHPPALTAGFHAHPELLWYFDLAVLLVSVTAILRHRRARHT